VWNCSNVFIRGPFFSMCSMSIFPSIVLYMCCVSKMCCAYLEFGLFVLIACMCSLYLVLELTIFAFHLVNVTFIVYVCGVSLWL
jgi:hypothetical protein